MASFYVLKIKEGQASNSFDEMIDTNEEVYGRYCEMLDIPNIYSSKLDFLTRYPFDESIPDSIISNLKRALL